MDNNLDRSIRLLEDVLSQSNRSLFKTKKSQRSKADLSITLLDPHERSEAFQNTINVDYTLADLLKSNRSISGTIIQSNSPWKTAIDSLYMEFFEILQSHSGDILEIINDLARCCSDALKVVQSLKSTVAIEEIEEEIWLENERNTWRLLLVLFNDRLLSQNPLMEDDGGNELDYLGRSEKKCVENLFKRENLIRETQLIIDWLEANAADRQQQILHYSDNTAGWENTLHQLQSAETIAFASTRQIVDKMDPDAPHYQKKSLHDLDMEDEKRLNKRLFEEIRCGRLEEAQKLCRQCGHSWKAALLEGWRLFHNPNIKENEDGECENTIEFVEELEGNSNRDIWKIMAFKYCKQEYIDSYEKASLASFCGYIDGMLSVCNTWEDCLWAYMKSMVDIRVETEIRNCCLRYGPYKSLPNEYWAQRMSLNEVFSNLESSTKARVRQEAQLPEHLIQKYIVLNEISKLLETLSNWTESGYVSHHFLRFVAHLVLFLDQIGQCQDREHVEKILESYIKCLMDMKQTQLVAYYVSKLNSNSQVLYYASYLEKIVENDERKEALIFAENSGLDVYAVTRKVVENIRNYPHELEESGNLQHKLTEADKFKISGLDWITFYANQRYDALIQTNALIFTFLTLGKLDAAQLTFNKIPADCVEKILNDDGEMNANVNQTIKEHLSYKAYLDAHEAFNEWFQQYKNRPQPPEDVPDNAQFPEKVAHQHRVSQFKAETERWKLTTAHLVKSAKTLLYNVLLFPEGWLIGASDADYLRSTCIPEIVLLLYSVLYESELYGECIQLADILASEKYGLYKVYSKEKLREILTKLTESSVALLNAKKDPWGNEASI